MNWFPSLLYVHDHSGSHQPFLNLLLPALDLSTGRRPEYVGIQVAEGMFTAPN